MKPTLVVAFIALCAPVRILAGEPSATPQPQLVERPKPKQRTVDKSFIAATAALTLAWTADAISTRYWMAHCPTCTEAGLFAHGTRDFARSEIGTAAFDVGMGLAAYEWKRHVRNRVLNKLWLAPFAIQISAHSQAAWLNYH